MISVGAKVGNYEVLQKIGEGAMASVYMAHHPTIGKRVALKVIHPELAVNTEMLARFFNEARAVTQIGHVHIVDVRDFGQTPDGDSFIVMELLEGRTLGQVIKSEAPLAPERACRIASQMCEGLGAAHVRGIIHRDVKPDNVMLIERSGDPDFVKLLDFGLAKLFGAGASMMQAKTRAGSLLGTAHYMAPEQAENSQKIDQRVDIYALGCMLFEMLTGRVPFMGEGFGDVIIKHLREPPPMLSRINPKVSVALERVILHALAKKPEFRFISMDEFREALGNPEEFSRKMNVSGITSPQEGVSPLGELVAPDAPTLALPSGAPQRLGADAATMMGAAPAEVQQVLAARAHASAMQSATPQRTMFLPTDAPPPVAMPMAADTLDDYEAPEKKRMSPLVPAVISISVLLAIAVAVYAWSNRGGLTRVHLQSEPSGVEVLLGDRVLGVTPFDTQLERLGAFELEFRKSGFLSAKRTVSPREMEAVSVRLLAAPPPPEPEEPKPQDTKPAEPPPPPKPVVTRPAPKPIAAKPAPPHKPPAKHKTHRPLHDMLLEPSF